MAKYVWIILLPAAIGIAGGYALHRYQASGVRNEFTPYRAANAPVAGATERVPYSYIAAPTEVNFGEIDNYKRYRTEWDVANTGLGTLEIELATADCDVEFEGKPLDGQVSIPGQSSAKIAMSWVVDSSDERFERGFSLKTNDGVEERKLRSFRTYGVVHRAFHVQPPVLEFKQPTGSVVAELKALVLCYRTKNFKIERFTVTPESAAANFDVKIMDVAEPAGLGLTPAPVSAAEISVAIKPGSLPPAGQTFWLHLQSNVPETEGLKVGLRVESP